MKLFWDETGFLDESGHGMKVVLDELVFYPDHLFRNRFHYRSLIRDYLMSFLMW